MSQVLCTSISNRHGPYPFNKAVLQVQSNCITKAIKQRKWSSYGRVDTYTNVQFKEIKFKEMKPTYLLMNKVSNKENQ